MTKSFLSVLLFGASAICQQPTPPAPLSQEKILQGIRAATDSDLIFLLARDIKIPSVPSEPTLNFYESILDNSTSDQKPQTYQTVAITGAQISQAVKNLVGKYHAKIPHFMPVDFVTYGILGVCPGLKVPQLVDPANFKQCQQVGQNAKKQHVPLSMYMIDGELSEDTRAYRVTVSQSLIDELTKQEDLGDDPDTGKALPAQDFKSAVGASAGTGALTPDILAARVCATLHPDSKNCGPTQSQDPAALPFHKAISVSTQKCPTWAFDRKAEGWPHPPAPGAGAVAPPPDEAEQQGCAIWRFSLQNLQASVNVVSPNHPDNSVSGNYTGVADSRASATHSHTFAFSGASDFAREGAHLIFGVNLNFNASQSVQGDGTASIQKVSFQQNQMSTYPYFQFVSRRRTWNWSYLTVAPVEYIFQPLHPEFLYAYNNPANSGGTGATSTTGVVNFTPRRSYSFREHGGTRFDGAHTPQGQDNYLEFGYQRSHQNNVITEVDFRNQGSGISPCPVLMSGPALGKTVPGCASKSILIDGNTAISAQYTSVTQNGFYWTFKGTWNILGPPANTTMEPFKGLSLIVDGQGDLFINNKGAREYATQTHIDSTLDVSLNIPSYWQGLSVKPTFTLFAFENQVAGNHVFDKTYSLKLAFNLDRHSRIGFLDALRFGPAAK